MACTARASTPVVVARARARMRPEDAARFFSAYSAWCPTGRGTNPPWYISVLNERLDLSRAHDCIGSGMCRLANDGPRHSERCAFHVLPKAREYAVLTSGGDERALSFAYASALWDDEKGKFVVHHTWTPERLRGRGVGKKAVRGAVEFVAIFSPCPPHIKTRLRGGPYDRRYKLALAEYVDATCPFAKRALEELRREANL